jgi:hypothetical protein
VKKVRALRGQIVVRHTTNIDAVLPQGNHGSPVGSEHRGPGERRRFSADDKTRIVEDVGA